MQDQVEARHNDWAVLRVRRSEFVGKVIGSMMSGLESYVLLPTAAKRLDVKILKYVRRLELGKACEKVGAHLKALSSGDLWR